MPLYDFSNEDDKALIVEGQKDDQRYQVAQLEAMRRLKNSMDNLRQSTDKYSRWLIWLTLVLAALTAVLVYKAFRP
jgi:hypothetical protein